MANMEKIALAAASHPEAGVYEASSQTDRRNAAAAARLDVLAFLGGCADEENELFISAVAEQCIFLLNTRGEQSGARSFLTSERIEGAGSVTYDVSRAKSPLSPRALQYCRAISAGRNRISRG